MTGKYTKRMKHADDERQDESKETFMYFCKDCSCLGGSAGLGRVKAFSRRAEGRSGRDPVTELVAISLVILPRRRGHQLCHWALGREPQHFCVVPSKYYVNELCS